MKPNQTKPNKTKQNKTKPNQTNPQTNPNQTNPQTNPQTKSQVGKTKIYFKQGILEDLEKARQLALNDRAVAIQVDPGSIPPTQCMYIYIHTYTSHTMEYDPTRWIHV